jgi:hypothetical protein
MFTDFFIYHAQSVIYDPNYYLYKIVNQIQKMEAIRPIETEQEYRLALAKMESIFHAIPNTMEGDILELLALAIEEYEEKYYKIEP